MAFSVRVLDENQEPYEGKNVSLKFIGWDGGFSSDEYTDDDGYAYFDDYKNGTIKVFIDGSSYGEYYYRDGSSINITV